MGVARARHGEEDAGPLAAISPEKRQLLQNARKKTIAMRLGSPENGDHKTALFEGLQTKVKSFNTMQLK
jgi:hypothetical protein